MTGHPVSIVFSWIELQDNKPVKVVHALHIDYLFSSGTKLQDTSLGREILTGLTKGYSPNIWFSDKDAYEIEHMEKEDGN